MWIGIVLTISEKSFFAKLHSLEHEDFEADFPFSVIHPEDQNLLCEGAVFHWIISNQISTIRFKQTPPWTTNELKSIENIADYFESCFSL